MYVLGTVVDPFHWCWESKQIFMIIAHTPFQTNHLPIASLFFLAFLKKLLFFVIFILFAFIYVHYLDTHGGQNWSYTGLWAAMWVLELEPRTSERAACAPNCGTISPVPISVFLESPITFGSLFWLEWFQQNELVFVAGLLRLCILEVLFLRNRIYFKSILQTSFHWVFWFFNLSL